MKYSPETALLVQQSAIQHLRRFARDPEAICQNSFLLKDGFLVGLRFQCGPFTVEWREGEDVLSCFRDGQPILKAPLRIAEGDHSERAA